jgi:hypothetical protein
MRKLVGLLLLVIIVIAALGYFGIIPGLSGLFGGSDPVDLGVSVTAEDYASASDKLGRERGTIPPGGSPEDSIRVEGSHPVDTVLTQEELTATFQNRDWVYNPFSNDVQIRVNPDNTIEMSGTLLKDNIIAASSAFGFSADDLSVVDDALSAIKGNPTFHIKLNTSIQNNDVSLNMQELKFAKLPIPSSAIPGDLMAELVEGILYHTPGLSCESLSVEDGKVHFNGTYPNKTYYQPSAD